jgi:hypothetical protein
MASEEHRTENQVNSQSVYKQPVVVDEHLTHVTVSKVAIRVGVEENHETRFLRQDTPIKLAQMLRSSLMNETFVSLQHSCLVLCSMAI